MYKSGKKPVGLSGPTPSGGAAAGTSAPIAKEKVACKKRINKATPATQSKKVREPFHLNFWQQQQLISTRVTIVQDNKPKKGMWWSTEELDMMLDIIADIKPTGFLYEICSNICIKRACRHVHVGTR
jgi:hypothetical protein